MFKAFITRNEVTTDGKQSYEVSVAINGEELFNMMPEALQNEILDLIDQDEEIKDMFKRSFAFQIIAQKVVDITNMNNEEYQIELDEVSATSFFDS
jgi:hypothetical protein